MMENKIKEFNKYFDRQIQLWGKETQLSLQNKKIVIIGSGGLGCSLGISLGASGIGYIDIVDFDTVGIHNIHRQIGFTIEDEGKPKAHVLRDLLLSRCPYVKVKAYEMSFEEFILESNEKYDLIIDATDNLPVRIKIDNYAKSQHIPWLYGSVEGFHGQVCFFDLSSYESLFNISDHKPDGIAAPIVMNIASLQANIALRYLVNLSIKKDFLYYCFFNDEGEFTMQKFGLPK